MKTVCVHQAGAVQGARVQTQPGVLATELHRWAQTLGDSSCRTALLVGGGHRALAHPHHKCPGREHLICLVEHLICLVGWIHGGTSILTPSCEGTTFLRLWGWVIATVFH